MEKERGRINLEHINRFISDIKVIQFERNENSRL